MIRLIISVLHDVMNQPGLIPKQFTANEARQPPRYAKAIINRLRAVPWIQAFDHLLNNGEKTGTEMIYAWVLTLNF